ncbi:MAG: HAD family phosphatase [Bacteroidales bacterium]|nr:HAD family phosphatase [Bacteroidales bacterium]
MKRRNIACLFDLDGVIFDTENNYTEFWTNVGKRYFPEKKDFASVIKGHSIGDILSEYFSDFKQDWNRIEEDLYEMERKMFFPFIEGAEDFVRSLQKADVPVCLVTSSDKIKMETVLSSRPQIKELFEQMVIATDVIHAKPAPDCYLLGAKKLGAAVEDCVVFEDSFAGIEAGRSAGMKVVGLATTNPYSAVKERVDAVIYDFKDFTLEDILKLF